MTARTVLVVEDDANIRSILVRALEEQGYSVLFAEDGERGWELLPNADFIILDLGLPKLRGEEILKRIADQKRTVPVIVITATDFSEEKREEMKDYGIVDFLQKPFKMQDVLDHVKKANGKAEVIEDASSTLDTSTIRMKEFIKRQDVETTPHEEELNPPHAQ